jgi:hypothetical protein
MISLIIFGVVGGKVPMEMGTPSLQPRVSLEFKHYSNTLLHMLPPQHSYSDMVLAR